MRTHSPLGLRYVGLVLGSIVCIVLGREVGIWRIISRKSLTNTITKSPEKECRF